MNFLLSFGLVGRWLLVLWCYILIFIFSSCDMDEKIFGLEVTKNFVF
jgi:hypothetical protein